MKDPRKYGKEHITNSIQQIEPNTWLVGGLLLHRRELASGKSTWTDDEGNASYELEEAGALHSLAYEPPDGTKDLNAKIGPYVNLIHDVSDRSAVWSIGKNVICKVGYIEENTTAESVTLNWVRAKNPSFKIPKVIRHVFDGDRFYLFITRVPGRTLDCAWTSLSEDWRYRYANVMAGICDEMAAWKGAAIGGVDGGDLKEHYLGTRDAKGQDDIRSSTLQATCEELGLDCSDLVFMHTDLGPTNLIVEEEPDSGSIGVVDFEVAGFFPKGWLMTKFQVSSGHCLTEEGLENPNEWRSKVIGTLADYGYDSVGEAFMKRLEKEDQHGEKIFQQSHVETSSDVTDPSSMVNILS